MTDAAHPDPQPASALVLSPTAGELELLLRARYPLIALLSWEEERALANIAAVADQLGKTTYEWSVTRGLVRHRLSTSAKTEGKRGTKDPIVVLREILDITEPAVVVLKDFHLHLKENAVKRGLRDLAQALKLTYVSVVILAPPFSLPTELVKDMTILDMPLPALEELDFLLQRIEAEIGNDDSFEITREPESRRRVLDAALGLTLAEAENVFAKTLVACGRLGREEVGHVFAEKKQIIRKSGLLEYVDVSDNLDQVGGLDSLKQWVRERRIAFSEKAKTFGLPAPKGLLLTGVQGCGKSLCAKAIAQLYEMPLLRLDMGRIFASYVGESESHIREALSLAESVSPCVLWMDEIDKALGGLKGGGSSDSGTTQRVFGTLVTWMQENRKPVFTVATANNIAALPPEVMRKGRFDEIFFVDLPDETSRRAILSIHIARLGRDPKQFDLAALALASEGFSGAELEAAVHAGMFRALNQDRDLTTGDLLKAFAETFPLSFTMREDIEKLRLWAKGRARPAA